MSAPTGMLPSQLARLWCGLLAVALLPPALANGSSRRPATQEEVTLLLGVLQQTASDLRRWAYTERRVVRDDKGRLKSETILRHDPSKPYAEQWTPLRIKGREPTDRERAKYRRRGEAGAPTLPGEPARTSGRERPSLGQVIDLGRASIIEDTPTHLVFDIPLRKSDNDRFPPEKFEVHATLRKDGHQLETIAVRLRESFRAKLVLKVKSGGGVLTFAQVDPRHPPTLVSVQGDASASMLFIPVGGSLEVERTELKRVKPFDERFEVQIGDLRALDF